jgi:hypothetical protein
LRYSNCATNEKEIKYLLELLGKKKFATILLYSGSKHGWMLEDFHSRCDKKGPTISLFRVKDGDCIGGFTSANWSSDNKEVADTSAMLFNLTKERCFPHTIIAPYAIGRYSIRGPSFTGGDSSDLCAL